MPNDPDYIAILAKAKRLVLELNQHIEELAGGGIEAEVDYHHVNVLGKNLAPILSLKINFKKHL